MKLLKMSNFTFFHNVFYAICILKSFNRSSYISVVVCSFFEFGTVLKWCIREWVNAVFDNILVPSRLQVHLLILFLQFFLPILCAIFFPSHWLLSHITIVETMDNGERGMNPGARTIINPRNEYWPEVRTHELLFSGFPRPRRATWARLAA